VVHKRLLARIPEPRISPVGICDDDIARIPVTPDFIAELLECLKSSEPLDLTMGFFIARAGLGNPEFSKVAGRDLSRIAELARRAFAHLDRRVRSSALATVVAYRTLYDDYANLMLGQLASEDASCRRIAVGAAPTYLTARDLTLLVPFHNDPEYGETGGMGGPLRYTIRDLALEVAEQIAGRSFPAGECSERVNETTVSWRSWASFLRWINRPKLWRMFGG
jgi:hypothetical protein